MARIVRGGLIQASNPVAGDETVKKIKQAMIEKHVKLIAQAAKKGVQVLCMQEIFYGPYFCCEQELKWYESTERVPEGPTTKLMQQFAKKHSMVIVAPVYEEEGTGTYYNTAAVIETAYLGKCGRTTSPLQAGFWENSISTPQPRLPVFGGRRQSRRVICYGRISKLAHACLGGAEIVFNPSATAAT
jgi:N-carbamoylputrescine amidase